jgi:hypothetical protein
MNIFSGAAKPQVVALMNCRHTALVPLFTKLLDDTKDALVTASDTEHVRRLQGRAEVLRDLMAAIEEAPSVLERMERNRP